jgi:hypothetical protein
LVQGSRTVSQPEGTTERGHSGGTEFQANPDLRSELIIDPGARSISGASQGPVRFDGGRFLGVDVPLGELRTDAAGRLLVLGGFGHSDVTRDGKPITTFANNDFWYDDTSDGPVTATVTFGDKASAKSFPVTAARVLVTHRRNSRRDSRTSCRFMS